MPPPGIEPGTFCLQDRCSTTEPHRHFSICSLPHKSTLQKNPRPSPLHFLHLSLPPTLRAVWVSGERRRSARSRAFGVCINIAFQFASQLPVDRLRRKNRCSSLNAKRPALRGSNCKTTDRDRACASVVSSNRSQARFQPKSQESTQRSRINPTTKNQPRSQESTHNPGSTQPNPESSINPPSNAAMSEGHFNHVIIIGIINPSTVLLHNTQDTPSS